MRTDELAAPIATQFIYYTVGTPPPTQAKRSMCCRSRRQRGATARLKTLHEKDKDLSERGMFSRSLHVSIMAILLILINDEAQPRRGEAAFPIQGDQEGQDERRGRRCSSPLPRPPFCALSPHLVIILYLSYRWCDIASQDGANGSL